VIYERIFMYACYDCGNIWISKAKAVFCPMCNSKNIKVLKESKVPIRYIAYAILERRGNHE